jgi:hypothetical protein
MLTRNPDTLALKDADSTPTFVVRKNGSTTGDSVTITKRSATTGIYDCSYTPSGAAETDSYIIEESAVITGTTTGQQTYPFAWSFRVIALERGTESAALATGVNVTQIGGSNVTAASGIPEVKVASIANNAVTASAIATGALTAAKFADGAFDAVWSVTTRTLSGFGTLIADIWAYASRTITGTVTLASSQPNYAPAKAGDAMTLTSGERTAVANEVEAQIIDDTDSERVLQAIIDKIAAANPSLDDLTLGAIASAVRTELATELAKLDATVSSRATQTSVDTIDDFVDTEMAATKTAAEAAKAAAESVDTKLSNDVLTKINGSAQTGADGDTLELLSDQIDGVVTTLATIPKIGETYRYTQDAFDEDNATADVTITEVP